MSDVEIYWIPKVVIMINFFSPTPTLLGGHRHEEVLQYSTAELIMITEYLFTSVNLVSIINNSEVMSSQIH